MKYRSSIDVKYWPKGQCEIKQRSCFVKYLALRDVIDAPEHNKTTGFTMEAGGFVKEKSL